MTLRAPARRRQPRPVGAAHPEVVGRHQRCRQGNAPTVRALLTGFFLATLGGDETYEAFTDADAVLGIATNVDPSQPDEDDRSHIDKLFGGPPAPKKSSSGGVAPLVDSGVARLLGTLEHYVGIVGYVGKRQALGIVVDALRRMEYRGYDSAGVAILDGHGGLVVERRPAGWRTSTSRSRWSAPTR